MGVVINEKREGENVTYTHLISLTYETNKEKRSFSGTVFGNSHARIVQIYGYPLEINPEGHLLIYTNIDKPGMLASVGSILAAENINIAGLSLGRDNPGQKALTIINIDSPISSEILRKLEKIEGVLEVRAVKL